MASLIKTRCISKNLWIKVFILLSLYTLQFRNHTFSQELKLIHEWEVKDATDATSDFAGNIYVSNNQGEITKFDKNGLLLLSFSGSNLSPISSLDVSHTSKIFGLYRDNQSYIILDRFLNPVMEASLDNSLAGNVTETAYSADNNLWIFDQSNISINKISLINNVLITNISISLVFDNDEWEIRQIEEYQNRLYIYNASKDVYVFDNLGNYMKRLNIKPDCNFFFKGSYLIYIQSGRILKIDLYQNLIQQFGTIDNTKNILKIISANNFIYLVSKNKVSVFK